jgi:exodeoxyribonuclease V alpha subunit
MPTHLSARLVWHDDAWNGRVCQHPNLNVSCVMHEHIRQWRNEKFNEKRELDAGGMWLADLKGWQPPCIRDPGAFSERGFRIAHNDPLDFRSLPSVDEDIPPYSFCPSPYRWMREENFRAVCESENLSIRGPEDPKKDRGWVFEPDRQRALLERFWSKFDVKRSLVFFYCNQANPLDEEAARIIIGVGRIVNISGQLYFGTKDRYRDKYPVWSRTVTHGYPDEGVRLPYQEYLRKGYDVRRIACYVPDRSLLDFSYVGEHVSDDVAVGVLERLLHSLEAVIGDNKIAGNWPQQLHWLNDVLSEVWSGRGPFPGIGNVLRFLEMPRGTLFQRTVLLPRIKNGENPWKYVESILEGNRDADEAEYAKELHAARDRWKSYPASRRQLLSLLTRFELSQEQIARVAKPELRAGAGIKASDEDLCANPYLMCEQDQGDAKSDPVALETIDRGMRPEGDAAIFLRPQDLIAQDDARRTRATTCAVLSEAADAGDTLLPFPEALRLVKRWGSCTVNSNINFNWRLIKAPMFVIDYVIVHELAHLIEANHTSRFWGIVRAKTPTMEKAKAWLKKQGQILEEEV